MLRTLDGPAAVRAATGNDPLVTHLVSHLVTALPAYASGSTVGIVCDFWGGPEAFVLGDPAGAVEVAEALLAAAPEVGWLSAPVGLTNVLAAAVGWYAGDAWAFRWTAKPVDAVFADRAEWLPPEADDEVRDLLAVAFPDASMPVGHPEVRRWAGIRRAGVLVAAAADATAADEVGFLASIASHPDVRGTGAGAAVTAWATGALLAEHPVCGLWHHQHNTGAAALYTRLGFADDHRMRGLHRDPPDVRP